MQREDLKGSAKLAIEAVNGVTALVEAVHMNVLNRAIGTPVVRPVRAIANLVYRSIGFATALTGKGVDLALSRAAPLLSEPDWKGRGAVLAALNGVLGDHLEAQANPLAIRMRLSPEGGTGKRILVMLHGLCMSGAQWRQDGVDHGAMLSAERGYTVLYADYNSGRHISDNGRDFAAMLAALAARAEVKEIVVVAHSMGGLVLRSALHQSPEGLVKLKRVVFLGTPHLGAPLERAGNWINTIADLNSYSAPFAKLAKLRSAGITDLRHGSISTTDWRGKDRFANAPPGPIIQLPVGPAFYAIGGHLGEPGESHTDGLVPIDSALGRAGVHTLAFVASATIPQTGHFRLLSSARVRECLLEWL